MLNRHWIDLVHLLSVNYFFHSQYKAGPIVSQHCTNVGNQQSISYIGPTFKRSSESTECHFCLGPLPPLISMLLSLWVFSWLCLSCYGRFGDSCLSKCRLQIFCHLPEKRIWHTAPRLHFDLISWTLCNLLCPLYIRSLVWPFSSLTAVSSLNFFGFLRT